MTAANPAPAPVPAQTAATTSPSSDRFVTNEPAGEWRASKLVGVDVYDPGNKKIGDIAEVILNRFERVAILDLDLVSSTKVNAAVPFGWIAKLDMQLEIVERLASDEAGAGTRVCEYAIHGTPVCSRRLPARHVRAVEESDRRPPARRRRAAQ